MPRLVPIGRQLGYVLGDFGLRRGGKPLAGQKAHGRRACSGSLVVVGGEKTPAYWPGPEPATFAEFDVDHADTDEAFAIWREACARSRSIVDAVVSLDCTVTWHDEVFSVRCVLTHMIEEYARHNGHADLLRERIDGATGE
ncbi:DUF664 domain-containing protein [Streptomyces sp. NPDC048483]|uniref:mycothiol transferase n=1 Tax=Streptomyces sp. NPDC048483 TaxID=3154927 RepID=UPI0034156C2B